MSRLARVGLGRAGMALNQTLLFFIYADADKRIYMEHNMKEKPVEGLEMILTRDSEVCGMYKQGVSRTVMR